MKAIMLSFPVPDVSYALCMLVIDLFSHPPFIGTPAWIFVTSSCSQDLAHALSLLGCCYLPNLSRTLRIYNALMHQSAESQSPLWVKDHTPCLYRELPPRGPGKLGGIIRPVDGRAETQAKAMPPPTPHSLYPLGFILHQTGVHRSSRFPAKLPRY